MFEQGDLDGNGAVETSGASLLKLKLTIDLISSASKTALEFWNDLDDFIANYNSDQQTLSITFDYDPPQTITFIGKASKGYGGDFTEGDPDSLLFSMGFSVEIKGAIT